MKPTVSTAMIALFVLLIAAGAALGWMLYKRPLGEPMTVQANAIASATATQEDQAQPTSPPATCGQKGVMNILFIGADFSMGVPPLGADAVRFIKADFDQQRVTVVAFPRDLVLNTPALKNLNITSSPLGVAYQERKEAAAGTVREKITSATQLVAQTLYDNFNYPPDPIGYSYITVQLDEVGSMIDTIGGVEIDLPQAIITERGVSFPAGKQVLDGSLSAEILRAYQPGGEPARLKRQNLFVTALRKKALNTDILFKAPQLFSRFNQAVVTSLSPEQIQSLACLVQSVPESQIEFHEISVNNQLAAQGQGMKLIPDVGAIQAALKQWMGE